MWPVNKESDYFAALQTMAQGCHRAALTLQASWDDFQPSLLPQNRQTLHEISQSAMVCKRNMVGNMMDEFFLPLDGEDLLEIAAALCDVTVCLEGVQAGVYQFHIKRIRPEAKQCLGVVVQCCGMLTELFKTFRAFKKTNDASRAIVATHRLQRTGKEMQTKAVHSLYAELSDPLSKMAWVRLFELLQACCDACAHVANEAERIVLKNR